MPNARASHAEPMFDARFETLFPLWSDQQTGSEPCAPRGRLARRGLMAMPCRRLPLLLALSVVLACGAGDELTTRAQAGFERGVAGAANRSGWTAQDVWALQEASLIQPFPPLVAWVGEQRARLRDDPRYVVLDVEAPPLELPNSRGRGISQITWIFIAPFGVPQERAARWVSEFVGEDELVEYVLNHQYLVLYWSRERGLTLPQETLDRAPLILQRIAEEQARDDHFTDLYAERVAILLSAAPPERAVAEVWIQEILDAQRGDGTWLDPEPSLLVYRGQVGQAMQSTYHTTALCVWALALFLENYPAG